MIFRAERRAQRARLLGHMRDGNLMPGDVGRILKTFDKGWAKGSLNETALPDFANTPDFMPFSPLFRVEPTIVLTGRFWQARRLFAQAAEKTKQRQRVTVLLFSLSGVYHRVWFDPRGFWVQRGGQFGKSTRTGRIFQLWRTKSRIRHEVARNSDIRKIVR